MRLDIFENPLYTSTIIIDRLRKIEEYIAKDELAPCDSDGYIDEYACGSLCDKTDTRMDSVTAEKIKPTSIKRAAVNYHTALVLREQADEMQGESKQLLGAYLQAANLKSMDIEGLRIIKVKDSERTTYDIPDEVKKTYAKKVPKPGYIMIIRME